MVSFSFLLYDLFVEGANCLDHFCWRCSGHSVVLFPQALICALLGLQEGLGSREMIRNLGEGWDCRPEVHPYFNT